MSFIALFDTIYWVSLNFLILFIDLTVLFIIFWYYLLVSLYNFSYFLILYTVFLIKKINFN